jgi:recombinational DNA repair protein RecT
MEDIKDTTSDTVELVLKHAKEVVFGIAYERDDFKCDTQSGEFQLKPAEGDRGSPAVYFVKIVWKEGYRHSPYLLSMSRKEMVRYARVHSSGSTYDEEVGSFVSGPWATHFDELAKAKILRKACFMNVQQVAQWEWVNAAAGGEQGIREDQKKKEQK